MSPLQIGMEGKGFEPTVDALFGENGFFPDTALKTMYFVSANMPLRLNEIIQNMLPVLKKDRMKRQVLRPICFVHINQTKNHCNYNKQFFVKEKSCNGACASVFRPPRT